MSSRGPNCEATPCGSREGALGSPLPRLPEPDILVFDDPVLLLTALAVIFLTAIVQGVTGFGMGLLAIGFLAMLFGAKEGVLLLTLIAPAISIVVFVRHWRETDWREVLWLAIPLVIGTAPGLWLFREIEAAPLRRVVGGLLVLFTVWYALPLVPTPRRLSRGWAVAAGLSAGVLGGLTSTGGPPLVAYLLVASLEKRRGLAVLQAVFVIGSLIKVGMAGAAGLFTGPLVWWSIALTVPLVAGALLGQRFFDRLHAEILKRISLVVLGVMGIALAAGL